MTERHDKIDEITEGDENLNTNYTHLKYYYGIDNQRRKMTEETYEDAALVLTRTKYYSGVFDREITEANGVTTEKEINFIFAPDGLAAIYEKKNGTGNMYYVSTDNLGSINIVADAQGNIVNDLSYDAWGRRRNPYTWEQLTVAQTKALQPTLTTDRGYTLHEHMDAFGLINMNGRAYDPLVGQFLSPDPFIQSPTSPQSYNRYSYCWNNPLKFVDPSGYYTIDIDGLQFQSHSLSYLAGVFGNDNVESIYSRGYDNKPIQFREVVNSYTYYDPIPKYLGSGESINDYRHTVTNRYYYAIMGLEGDPPTGRKGFSNTQIIPPKLNVNNLYVSQRGIDFIISFEGAFHSQSYDATGKGDWTIGWGHKIKQGEHFSNITVDDGRKLFEKDLKETIDQINYYVEVPLSQNQYDALVSYVFNAGSGNVFVSSKGVTRNFLNALNNGNYSEACSQMDIVTQPGHVVRRQKERVLWTFGTYNYGY